MRKPVLATCKQQRCRTACASAQSDTCSTFVVRYLDSIIPLISISEISRLYLVSIFEQAGLSLTWSKNLKTGVLVTWLNEKGWKSQ